MQQIFDAQDGGRIVFRCTTPALPEPVHVIAVNAPAATAWLERLAGHPLPELTATDAGSADRTEIGLWHDASRLSIPTTARERSR